MVEDDSLISPSTSEGPDAPATNNDVFSVVITLMSLLLVPGSPSYTVDVCNHFASLSVKLGEGSL